MLGEFLKNHITSQAGYIQTNGIGYGQVEPNHLSAQRTGQIYAQLPANKNIDVLENGQFVKYDYAAKEVNFTGPGEWMLVFNEIKLYRDHQMDCEFAMLKDNYQARVYSPFGGAKSGAVDTVDFNGQGAKQSRYYNGKGLIKQEDGSYELTDKIELNGKEYKFDDVTAGADYYEPHYNDNPFMIEGDYKEALMPEGTTMVPRVLKTNVGDIFTTNMIADASVAVGDILCPAGGNKGILTKVDSNAQVSMKWQVVKVYTMPDHQPGVKIMRIA